MLAQLEASADSAYQQYLAHQDVFGRFSRYRRDAIPNNPDDQGDED